MLFPALSYFIIPGLTLFMARGTNWFSTNFSVISNALSRQMEFLFWSIITGAYFFYGISRLLNKRRTVQNIKKEAMLLLWAMGMMTVFVLSPYLPAQLPFLSVVHVLSALFCSVLFFLCLLSLTLRAYKKAPKLYRPCLFSLMAAALFCLWAFLVTGIINTAMEICFVITCSVLVNRLLVLESRLY